MNNKAIFVVDMINGFVKEGALSDIKINEITPNIIKSINKVGRENTYFIVDSHTNESKEFDDFLSHCLRDTNEAKIIDELLPYVSNDIVYKNSTNAFHVMDINKYLKYDNYYVVGCCTDICVISLAISLKTYINENNLAKEVYVVEDACSTFDIVNHSALEYHNMAIKLMMTNGIKILSSEEI